MKVLLVAEYRKEMVQPGVRDLISFAEKVGASHVMFMVGDPSSLPQYEGTLYLADAGKHSEYNPDVHKRLLLNVIEKERPDMVVFSHSSYGWDLAPRTAFALKAAQVSEVVDYVDGKLIVPACNYKLRRDVEVKTDIAVVTVQAGAFKPVEPLVATPQLMHIDCTEHGQIEFLGYEEVEDNCVDLSKVEVIVSGGRGMGKSENVELIAKLAKVLGGEYGASRPVVDADWMEYLRQVGTTGQSVSPKLYIACGISGAIQHLGGMKNSSFVVAINTDRDAPIASVADVMVVADMNDFIPELIEKIQMD